MWRLLPRAGFHPGFSIHLYPDFAWCGLDFWVNFSRLVCDLPLTLPPHRPRQPAHECASLSPPGSLTKTSMRNSNSTSPSSSSSSPSPVVSCSTPGEGLSLGEDSVRGKALVSVLCTAFPRVTDAAFNFLLVWYYCTLTIRESILINNGSRCACAVGWVVPHMCCLWDPFSEE